VPFETRIWTRASPRTILNAAMRSVVPRLLADGYRLDSGNETMVVLTKTYRPGWTILAAVLLFPFGLLALLRQDRSQVVISVHAEGAETEIEVAGVAPLAVRRAVLELAVE
jgi:hypothetical protein